MSGVNRTFHARCPTAPGSIHFPDNYSQNKIKQLGNNQIIIAPSAKRSNSAQSHQPGLIFVPSIIHRAGPISPSRRGV
ncbi:hypothetical protein RRG08_038221 [Elysia crispata]|uniref:Uncharacterized protein n=1 Tax=Elysia crispata TaxID=231223 RepID=A0AAE1AMN7_9GAST|nr:hypothetical protein RRG08_038221 [Elysia crispata]